MSTMFSSKSSGGAPPAWRLPGEVVAERLAMSAIVPGNPMHYEHLGARGAQVSVAATAPCTVSVRAQARPVSLGGEPAVHEDHLPRDVAAGPAGQEHGHPL